MYLKSIKLKCVDNVSMNLPKVYQLLMLRASSHGVMSHDFFLHKIIKIQLQ